MALVRYGGGISEMSGSIGGTTFAKNSTSHYARNRTKPVNPNTSRQQAVRAAVAFLSTRWAQTLTAGQRTAWGLYGASVVVKNRLGENIHLSGFNHYIRSNAFRARAGFAPVDAGPVIFELPAQDPLYAITLSEGTQQITSAYDATMDWADEDNAYLLLSHGQPQNAQRNFFGGPWRVVGAVPGVNGAPPASPSINAIGYPIAIGQHNWGRARIARADGRLSDIFRADAFVAA